MIAVRWNENYVVYGVYVQSSITYSHCDSRKDLIMSVYNYTYLYIHPSGPRMVCMYVICKC